MTFIVAKPSGTAVPRIVERVVAAAADFKLGALLLVDVNGAYAECGANPALVFGAAESDYTADTSGFNLYGREGFPPGKMQASKALDTIYRAEYEGTLPVADGGLYNVIRSADGKWRVNFALQTATRVALVGREDTVTPGVNAGPGLSTGGKFVLVKFIAANCQDL
jgi:hypothetical protein